MDLRFHPDDLTPQMVSLIELTVKRCAVECVEPLSQLNDMTPKTVALVELEFRLLPVQRVDLVCQADDLTPKSPGVVIDMLQP